MLRNRLRKLSKTAFWLSKWLVVVVLLAGAVLAGVLLLIQSNIDFDTFLNYLALGLLIFVLITLFYGILAIHDVPYEIAKHRNHPHQDAIHAAGWVSLFTLHAIWPFLWIWAMLYRPDQGWGLQDSPPKGTGRSTQADEMEELRQRLAKIERRYDASAPAEIEELRQRVAELEKRSETRVH